MSIFSKVIYSNDENGLIINSTKFHDVLKIIKVNNEKIDRDKDKDLLETATLYFEGYIKDCYSALNEGRNVILKHPLNDNKRVFYKKDDFKEWLFLDMNVNNLKLKF